MLGLVAGGAAALLAGCGSTERYRYKMTVEVETPQGPRSGYAVREIVIRTPPSIPMLGEHRTGFGVIGEAVAVDIAPGKVLFALMTGANGSHDYAGRDVNFMFKELTSGKKGDAIELWPKKPTTRRPIIAEPMPILVTFRDVSDPTTAEHVEPGALEQTFGPGVILKKIEVSLVDQAITTGIDKRLNWINDQSVVGRDTWLNLPYESRQAVAGMRRGMK